MTVTRPGDLYVDDVVTGDFFVGYAQVTSIDLGVVHIRLVPGPNGGGMRTAYADELRLPCRVRLARRVRRHGSPS